MTYELYQFNTFYILGLECFELKKKAHTSIVVFQIKANGFIKKNSDTYFCT